VTRLNQGIARRGIDGRFMTGFYGLLSADGALTYSNAGHNAPILVTADSVRRLDTGGTVLGLFADARYEEETLRLSPGDVIIAFSDGVSEALDAEGHEYGDERLIACIKPLQGGTPQAILDALLADVHTFCGSATPSDDITIVVVRYGA
jgi:sigma-B regulation protein RsbU (phosphoserine phosphatase)